MPRLPHSRMISDSEKESGKPGGAVAGLPLQELIQAWDKPFLPESQGGCASQPEWPAGLSMAV